MNKQHNIGLAIVCVMVVLAVWLLRGGDDKAISMVIQFAAALGGGIVGNAMRDTPKDPGKPDGSR